MTNCKVVTGFPFSKFKKIKNAISIESDEESLVIGDSNLEWDNTNENYQKLDEIKNNIEKSESSTVFLVGFLFAKHVSYFEEVEELDLELNIIHSSPKKVINEFKKRFDDLPFSEENGRFPCYEQKFNYSPNDYAQKFYYEFEELLVELDGHHFDIKELKNKDFVESLFYNNLFEFEENNEFYSLLEENYESSEFTSKVKSEASLDKNKGVKLFIAVFLLPEELELFKKQSQRLLYSLDRFNKDIDFHLRAHLDLSDFYVKWEDSKLDKEVLYSDFNDLKAKYENYLEAQFTCFEGDIHGCNDIRRRVIQNNSDQVDCFSWLDPDTVFPSDTVKVLEDVLPRINQKYNLYGITPEIFRPKTGYLQPLKTDQSFKYEKPTFSSINRLNNEKRHIKRVEDSYRVNGAFSVISSDFLRLSGIPTELGHYGNDDIYINECMNIFNTRRKNSKVALFKMKNLVMFQDENWKETKSTHNFVFRKQNEKTSKKDNHRRTQSVLDNLLNQFKTKTLNQ